MAGFCIIHASCLYFLVINFCIRDALEPRTITVRLFQTNFHTNFFKMSS